VKNRMRSNPRRRERRTFPPHSGHFRSAMFSRSRAIFRFGLLVPARVTSRNIEPNWTRSHLMHRYGRLRVSTEIRSKNVLGGVRSQCVLLQRGQYIMVV
jgi:hypothetical protein